MMSVGRQWITLDRPSLFKRRSCSSWVAEPQEIEKSTEPIFGCLTNANFMMTSLIYSRRIDRILTGIVERSFLPTYGDTTSEDKSGRISRLDRWKTPTWSHHMRGMDTRGAMLSWRMLKRLIMMDHHSKESISMCMEGFRLSARQPALIYGDMKFHIHQSLCHQLVELSILETIGNCFKKMQPMVQVKDGRFKWLHIREKKTSTMM